MRCAGHVARMGKRGVYRALVEKLKGRPLGRPKRRWKDNIRTDLLEVVWGRILDRSCSG